MRDKSFLNRARPELIGATVSINWGSGRQNEDRSLYSQNDASDKYPMARYLSQQFVDDLCSSDGLTDKLLKEVERIIFNAHDVNEREGNIDFAGLLELKASRPRATREAEETSLQELCDSIGLELEKIKLIDETKAKIAIKEAAIKQYIDDRSKLVVSGSEARILRLGELTTAADKVRGYVRFYSQREQSLLNIQGDVKNFRVNKAPEELRGLKQKHIQSGLKDNDWSPFVVDFTGDVDKLVTDHLTKAQQDAKDWKGIVPSVLPPNSIHIPDNADLIQYKILDQLFSTNIPRNIFIWHFTFILIIRYFNFIRLFASDKGMKKVSFFTVIGNWLRLLVFSIFHTHLSIVGNDCEIFS